MYYNNMNGNEEDLKFIPLNITEPFREKNSTWFPIIDMALPAFSEIPNSFPLSFGTPIDNSNLQGNTLKTLDYIQNDNSNLENNKNVKTFEKDFDLEYPSETVSEELISYNKTDKCKKSTNNTNMNSQSNSKTNIEKVNNNEMSNFNGMDIPNTVNNPNNINKASGFNNPNAINNMNNVNGINNTNNMNNSNGMNKGSGMQNMNMESMTNREYIEEPIHMELLRNSSFEGYLIKSYRGVEEDNLEQVDMIFGAVKNDNSIVDTFKAYNIPKPMYELISKKIIKLTLDDENCKKGE